MNDLKNKRKPLKGCVFFNRSYTGWEHALMLDLKERYGVNEFCGYLYSENGLKLLNGQKDIIYKPLLVDEFLAERALEEVIDLKYLDEKEREYGTPFLWHYFTVDRHMINNWPQNYYVGYNPIFNHDQIKKQLQIRIREIEHMLNQNKPDFVFFCAPGAMGVDILYHIAKKKGIKCVLLTDSRLGDRQILTESMYGLFTGVDKRFSLINSSQGSKLKREDAIKWITQFRDHPIKPYWANPIEQNIVINPILFIKNLVRKIIDSFMSKYPRVYGNATAVSYLRRNFLNIINRYRLPRFDKFDPAEDYAFFPLHYDPEAATLLYAPFYVDQLALIKNISQSLPINFKLYIKEHPAMLTLRSPKYYKELKKIPNLKLIEPHINSTEIIRHSRLVLVITGTAGWEASILKKPVITFGRVFFNSLSFVKKCEATDSLPGMVKDVLEDYKYNEEELINFVTLLLEESFDIDFLKLSREKSLEKLLTSFDLKLLSDKIINFLKD